MSGISRARLLRGSMKPSPPPPLRPPWALRDAAAFRAACDGCGKCAPVCADALITIGEDGTPAVSFADAGCDFCGACADACPTGALHRDEQSAPWDHVARIGASCLSYAGVECRMCGDHCPSGAIAFHPLGRGRRLPTVSEADCSGCGACLGPCPARAITLNACASSPGLERGKACA